MYNLNNIINGYIGKNLNKLGLLNTKRKQMGIDRFNTCLKCELFDNGYCNPEKRIKNMTTGKSIEGCGCNLSAKVFCEECTCPADKW